MSLDKRDRERALEVLESDDENDDVSIGMEEADVENEIFGHDDLDHAEHIEHLYRHADSLTRKAALRQHKWAGMADVAKFVRINPASVLHGTLGGQQDVLSGQQIQVCNWSGEDAEATPVTITLAPVQQVTPFTGGTQVIRPYGIIQFGSRGMSVKAEVDILKGCQLTVSASSVLVQVAMAPELGTSGPASMKLAGMLSFFPCVRTAPVTRTRFIGIVGDATTYIAAGGTAQVDIPPFAKNVSIWRQSFGMLAPTLAGVQLDFQGADTLVEYFYTLAAGAFQMEPIPLSDDIVTIIVTNQSMTDPMVARLIFELSL